ncbi:MAG: hypothetical protein WBE86_04570 [Candidatus Acidiferrales bacterium]
MRETRHLGTLATAIAVIFMLAGCSHAVFSQSGGTGATGTSPLILTLHDTPASGVTVTSFEVTVSGAALEPGDISILSTPQTVELTQLQTNSVFLSTTQVPVGSYTGLTITYSNPQFTIINNSGVAITTPTGQCLANASCTVTNPTVTQLTETLPSASGPTFPSLSVTTGNQTLLEFDVNLNDVIQSNLSLDFSQSGAVTVNQTTNGTGQLSTIDTLNVAGEVTSVDASSSSFIITPTEGQSFTVTTNSAGSNPTTFEFARDNCTANNFTCIVVGQIVDVTADLQSDGQTFDAAEVDFDDAVNTQQVSGTIVSQTGTPPTSVLIVVHNTIPPVPSLPPGTAVTVTIGNAASYVINSGSFVLPSGLSFASTSDVIIGQEVEARVASTSSIVNDAFTTDRLALEQTQLEAIVSEVDSQVTPYPYFILSPLPALLSDAPVNPAFQLEIVDTSANEPAGATQFIGTVYQDLTPENIVGLTVGQPVTTSGFLFNTTGSVGSPSIIATIVRGEVPGT